MQNTNSLPVLLIFMKLCRLEKALLIEWKDVQGNETEKDGIRKGKLTCLYALYVIGGLRERFGSPLIIPMALVSSSPTVFPLHLASTKGEVTKRWETALHHQVILLPIALWLRTQSPNYMELYLFYSFNLKGAAIPFHSPLWSSISMGGKFWQWLKIALGLERREGRAGGCRYSSIPDWKLLLPLFLGKYCISSVLLHERETTLKVTLTSSLLKIPSPVSLCRNLFYQNKQALSFLSTQWLVTLEFEEIKNET